MASFVNNAVFVATSGGTGAFSVSAAATGYQTPAAAGASDTKTYRYRAYSSDFTQWEIGSTVPSSSATSFTRVVTASSAGGTTTVNFTNPPTVALSTVFAADLLQFDDAMSLTSAQKAQGRANLDVLKKNYIINGAMMVSQENGTTAGTSTGYYGADQFPIFFGHGGALSVAQVASATPGGSPNRLRVTVTTADASVAAGDYAYLTQKIEGLRAADLLFGTASAKTTTLQFGVKAPAGTYCVVFTNDASNRSYVAEYVISGGEANTDVVKRVTIAGDTSGTWLKDSSGSGLSVRWGLMGGSTYQQTANSWGTGNVLGSASQFNLLGTINNVFELFDVGLYEGSVAPSFVVPDYAGELYQCQRYWHKILARLQAYSAASDNIIVTHRYLAEMRVTPSVTFSSTTYTNASGIGTTVPHDTKGITVYATATGGGQANYSTTISLSARM